ncbi:MAG: hypothetical protein M1832_005897 [Thelocarpon impressellum]|nr:MAG: hypothetical protein M1832_005897 [Thelocarpon impressellum]
MKTLCATSTVGVAAVGYTFGRARRPVPLPTATATATATPTHKRKADVRDSPADDGFLPSPVRPATQPQSGSAPPPARGSSPAGPGTSPQLRTPPGVRRKKSAGWEGLKRLSDARFDEGSMSDHDPAGSDARASISSRKAWLRRRLSKVSTSQTPSPTSSPGPDSPSITFSNGSAAPMLHSSPLDGQFPTAPNKLVKRSSSQHASLRVVSAPMSAKDSRVLTLRRPATSHQRSATMQQQFGSEAVVVGLTPDLPSPLHLPSPRDSRVDRSSLGDGPTTDWRPYFQPRPSRLVKEDRLGKRGPVSSRPSNSAIRRILPDGRHRPALLKPGSITPSSAEDDDPSAPAGHQADDAFVFGTSRPQSPSGLDALFAPSEPEIVPAPTPDEAAQAPRRSFSIGDMFGDSPPSWMPRSRSIRSSRQGRISLSTGRRYSSAPQAQLPARSSVSAHAGRGPPRTDITDPSIFARDTHTSYASRPPALSSPPPLPRSLHAHPTSDPTTRRPFSACSAQQTPPRQSVSSPRLNLGSGPTSSPPTATATARLRRLSMAAPSDRASTLVDSDNEQRGSALVGEDDLDFQSDTVFDSLRTGATGSSSGARGPRIETMFDESPPHDTAKARIGLSHLVLPNAGTRDGFLETTHDIPEENESTSTPKKAAAQLPDDGLKTPVRLPREPPADDDDLHLPPPGSAQPLSLGKLEWDAHEAGKDSGRWSLDDDDDDDWYATDDADGLTSQQSSPRSRRGLGTSAAGARFTLAAAAANGASPNGSARRGSRDLHSSLFDWSESHPLDNAASKETLPRPKTVHGKQAVDGRGSRPTGRRPPAALHVRSQSVPVIPDPGAPRERGAATSRFGTWGLGSKGVSEDWNEDFEFDGFGGDRIGESPADGADGVDGRSSMIVPEAIQQRQASVIGHLGHVREFALLVEDLKRLRTQAIAKDIVAGPLAELWKEADGIIDLATVDDDNQDLPAPASPSSVGFGLDAFDDEPMFLPANARARRKSVLTLDDDIFGGAATASGKADAPETWSQNTTPTSAQKAERQNASAVARSVVETMHQRRTSSDPVLGALESNPQQKMPFDTTTLRDLVAHVGQISRRLAEAVRNAESLPSSPTHGPTHSPKLSPTPSFGQILAESAAGSPPVGKRRPSRGKNGNGVGAGGIQGKENELGGQLPMMAVV